MIAKLSAVHVNLVLAILATLFLHSKMQPSTAHAQPGSIVLPTPTVITKATATVTLTKKATTSATTKSQRLSGNNLVFNGDFESPIANWDMNTYSAGQTFDGWTVESGDIQLLAPGRWQNASGNQSVDLNGNTAGTLYQDLVTVPAQSYSLSFYMAGNAEGGPSIKTMEVWWGNTIVDTVSFDVTGYSSGNMGWGIHQYQVTAATSSTRLKFKT